MGTAKNKGGRPPKPRSEKRSAEVKFRVTADVKRKLQNEATAAGVDLAAYCREKVLTGRPPRRIPPQVLEALAALARTGNNLNQLARIANSQKSVEHIALRIGGLLDFYGRLAEDIRDYFYSKGKNDDR